MKEPILEPILRKMRLKQVLPYIKKYPNCKFLDIGCGWEAKLLLSVEPLISIGIGIDFKAPSIKTEKIQTLSITLDERLPFEDQSFDFITMLAVMEHLDNDIAILNECARVLKPGGGLLITVPSWHAKPILEFLSFKLKLINPSEILDHKRYYNREDLIMLVDSVDKLQVKEHKYFQWRFNNRFFCQRKIE
jgi:ubiquinone/menaquinone biosynthesis C-methylase UbiE